MEPQVHVPGSARALRVREMDALRGAAMVAVCLSHSSRLLTAGWGTVLGAALIALGFVATPTFLLLSGVVCGYMSRAVPETERQFRWRFIDRGLFLLLIAHLVLWLTHQVTLHGSPASFSNFYMTDAVGVALIVGALIARHASRSGLLFCGLMLFMGAWCVSSSVSPHGEALRIFIRLMFGIGDASDEDEGYIVPIVPYLGIFVIGIAGGTEYAQRRDRAVTQRQVGRFCVMVGLACMAVALGVKGAWLIAKPYISPHWLDFVYQLTSPVQKIPPGPAYAVAYGGAGIFLAGTICLLSQRGGWRHLVSGLAVIGRASLVTFIAQYWVYYVAAGVPGLLNWPAFWFIALPVSLGLLWLLAYYWDRRGYNRYLTVGLRRLSEARNSGAN